MLFSRYRNPYKQPDTLAVADAYFDGSTSYTEQYVPTRVILTMVYHLLISELQANTPSLARHPWETSNVIAAGVGELDKTTTNSEFYKEIHHGERPELAWGAKYPHILPQGGVEGCTEYDHCYVPLRPGDGRVLPRWFTWHDKHQRSPFGLTARTKQQQQPPPVASVLR